ncbi:MAG: 50S ribosomal protein L21 [Deltaproteobacteria bacterium]|nr:50S ribosomal protein L21 [Deltaproteobacteria bacterium]
MYAVVESGGKQYKMVPGETVKVDSLPGDAGDAVTIDKVLLVADGETVKVGTPTVEGVSIKAEIVTHGRGKKLVVFKKKRRKKMLRKAGHRQNFTELKVTEIAAG